jgi:hypothetical protein
VAFSPELMDSLATNFNLNIPNSLSFHTRFVNNVLYIRLADFYIFGTQPNWVPEWLGIETRVLVSNTVLSAVESPDFSVESAQNRLTPPGAALVGSIIYHVPPEQLNYYADFMTLSSRGTTTQDGELVDTYRLTWDIARYLGGPLFAQQTGAAEFPSATSRLYGSMGTILLDGLSTYMDQSVGAQNFFVYSVDTEIRWALGIPGGPPLAERPTIGVSSTMVNSDLNAINAIPAPEGAVVLPIDAILAVANLLQR